MSSFKFAGTAFFIFIIVTFQSHNTCATQAKWHLSLIDDRQKKATKRFSGKALRYKTTKFNFESKLTGISYPVKLYRPSNYDQTDKVYPIVYATDGQWHGRDLVNKLGAKGIEVIWVAVEQGPKGRRTTDYVVPDSQTYYRFLTEEFIPSIEPKLRVNKEMRTLMGTSLGGLFVNTALLLEPAAKPFFTTYLSFDASMHIGKSTIDSLLQERYEKSDTLPVKLILTTASNPGNIESVKKFEAQLRKTGFKNLEIIRYDLAVDQMQVIWPSFDKVIPEAFLNNL